MAFVSINPATGEELARFEPTKASEVDASLDRAMDAALAARDERFEVRARRLRRAADLLERGADAFGRIMTLEMGKPIGQAVAEAKKCAWACRHYAEHGADDLAVEPVETQEAECFVRYDPLGPLLAIMPWNFPFWQVIRCAAPALMAGNVVLLKHAPNVPQCAIALEGIFRRAGFVEGAFQNLFLDEEDVEGLIADERIRGVSLTGSVRAGRAVAAAAGKRIKKTVLELGGSDPFIVMPSADLDAALDAAVRARLQNNGESCIAAKRFIVADGIADEFRERLVERFSGIVMGDPLDEETDLGPMAREDLRDQLHDQVRRTVEAEAELVLGGEVPEGPGWFYPPTILDRLPVGAPARTEELFGPVASLLRAADAGEALRLGNDTRFGLGASAWTNEEGERRLFVERLEAGNVAINGMVASDPRLPFGGIKDSGYGRELGRHGIREFVNIKSVKIQS